jgi:hypothetical protein
MRSTFLGRSRGIQRPVGVFSSLARTRLSVGYGKGNGYSTMLGCGWSYFRMEI